MQSNMTIKGQVTVPKAVRDRLGLKPGRPVQFVENAAGEVVIQLAFQDDAATQRRREGEQRVARFRAAQQKMEDRPLRLGMTVDEFMAQIREPVPL